jgi:hypothetical protein
MKKYRFPYANKNNRCHDCDVLPGEIHHEGCDVERCPFTGIQRIGCDCGECYKSLKWKNRVPFGFENSFIGKV